MGRRNLLSKQGELNTYPDSLNTHRLEFEYVKPRLAEELSRNLAKCPNVYEQQMQIKLYFELFQSEMTSKYMIVV